MAAKSSAARRLPGRAGRTGAAAGRGTHHTRVPTPRWVPGRAGVAAGAPPTRPPAPARAPRSPGEVPRDVGSGRGRDRGTAARRGARDLPRRAGHSALTRGRSPGRRGGSARRGPAEAPAPAASAGRAGRTAQRGGRAGAAERRHRRGAGGTWGGRARHTPALARLHRRGVEGEVTSPGRGVRLRAGIRAPGSGTGSETGTGQWHRHRDRGGR